MSLGKFLPQKSWLPAQKESSAMLSKSNSSFLKPPKPTGENKFENSAGSGENQRCFLIIMSYCSDNSEAKGTSAVLHGARRQHPCVRCQSKYREVMMVRKSSSRVAEETTKTQRKVKEM